MNQSDHKGAGIGGVIAVLLGIAAIVGMIFTSGGVLHTIFMVGAIIAIAVAVILIAIVVIAIAAAGAAKKDEEGGAGSSKLQTKQIITEKRQQIAKVKSKQILLENTLKKAKAANDPNVPEYEKQVAEVQKMVEELEEELHELENRRNSAMVKMETAKAKKIGNADVDDDAMNDFEEEAQREADMAEAMKHLNREDTATDAAGVPHNTGVEELKEKYQDVVSEEDMKKAGSH